MALTVGLAFVIPIFDNLDIAFQGFNTWHSLQYLALTWFILTRSAEPGRDRERLRARKLAGTAKTGTSTRPWSARRSRRGVYFFLWKGLGLPQDRSYYVVVLSFLLMHYFYDHILFREFGPLEPRSGHRGLGPLSVGGRCRFSQCRSFAALRDDDLSGRGPRRS